MSSCNFRSERTKIQCGVPQGPAHKPLLFKMNITSETQIKEQYHLLTDQW